MISARLRIVTTPPPNGAVEPPPAGTEPPADRVEQAYLAHYERVFYLAMRYGAGDRAWAEDVAQDVFIRLLHQFERGREVDSIGAWLYRTTTNRCLTKLKRARFLESPAVRFFLGTRVREPATPEDLGLRDEQARVVVDVLREASPKERACFFLYHIDHVGMSEIGELIGHSKGYVSKLVARVEARIQARHKEEPDRG